MDTLATTWRPTRWNLANTDERLRISTSRRAASMSRMSCTGIAKTVTTAWVSAVRT